MTDSHHSAEHKARVQAALLGTAAPEIAVGPLAVHFCAVTAGVPIRDYTLRPEVLADCVIGYFRRFKPDAVWISADTWVTAQAMGKETFFPGENQPMTGTPEPLVRNRSDLDGIPPPDPWRQGRWPIMLEATRRIVAELGNEAFVVACFDQYPFSLACEILGIERAMMLAVDDREFLDAVLARSADYTVAYAQALASLGVDLLSGGDSPAGLLGPRLYREVALPWEREVVRRLRGVCRQPISLHICGRATPLLADMASSGADVLELDQNVRMEEACRVLPQTVAIWGNLDPVAVLAQGTPADVVAATDAFLDCMIRFDRRRYVVSSGCTLAWETPAENLEALIRHVRQRRHPVARQGTTP